jgi:hypothetical protein
MQGRALDTMRGQLREAGLLDEYRSEVLGISGPVAGGGPGGFVANPGRAMTYREEINAMLDFMREKGLEPFEQAFGQGEALAKAIDSSAQLTQEQTAALGSLGVDIQALRDTIDRTYKQQARGPVQPPQAPPPGRGR